MRLARLAENQIGDSSAAALAALAAALPQMPSLTALHLGSTAMPAHCRFLLLGARASVVLGAAHAVCCGVRAHGRMWAAGFRVRGPVMVARLADNQIGASGATALAAALRQMPSLTTLHLYCTVMRARCSFLLFGACASVVCQLLAPCASARGRTVGCGRRALGSEGP